MRYLVDNETVDKTLKEIGLKPVMKDKSYAQIYKSLFIPNGWDYLYRGRGYIKNFDEVRDKWMPKWMQDKTRHLPDKNVSLYDIPFSFMMKHKVGASSPKTFGPGQGRPKAGVSSPKTFGPIINHYPNTPCITNKANLLRTLIKDVSPDAKDFLPLTFNLSKDNDIKAFE